MDIRQTINTTPMSAYQWFIVFIAVLLNALDGFDVLAMSFTANSVSEEFGLTGSQLGMLLSSALFGMTAGSLIFGPLGDRFGRKNALMVALLFNVAGLFLSSTAQSAGQLGMWRLLTGVGIGGILACITVVISEFANNKNRGMAISIYAAGYGIGASIGGLGAAQLIPVFGWRSVFLAGAIATAIATVVTFFFLPESVDWLSTRRPARAEERINIIARRLGKQGTFALAGEQTAAAQKAGARSYSVLLSKENRSTSFTLWAVFFIVMFGFYFANTWTPRLLVETGMSEQQGIIGGLMLSMGGAFGSLLYGFLTTKFNMRTTLMTFMVLSGATLILFISSASVPSIAFAAGVVVGMLINGCVAGLYTMSPQVYTADVRTTGVGTAIGVGRVGAILAPLLVGNLLDAGWSPEQLYIGVAIIVIAGATTLIGLRTKVESGVEKHNAEPANLAAK
ncbi:major facilitator superfamily permease [Corynebacterium deserti GIMN1.010]|uniref:Major facilitator superfamily permease n=1 Tax=Corynebacterium deserti GIMN1.010 TaxID=931089 RepID=A0A0M5IUE4_9CORY|nr:aromatic acid/H+ symport family MFS transporter [Corynebacterium deserti]ALC06544.1 major facilitator superfamily permease [Corynebacterium deserti GIMN1.010]